MTTKTDLWIQINANTALLEAVANCDLTEVAAMHALRKQWSVDEISIAASIVDARKRAKNKLTNADAIVADSIGVQQATSSAIAEHKALRFQDGTPVFDLCCGIGSDLRALPPNTVGVDYDKVRCVMAHHNSGKKTLCEDILALDIPADCVVHIDPSRRNESQRLHGIEVMQPSLHDLAHIIERCAGGCIKVSPSVDVEELDSFPIPFELEYIEELGRVVQGVIWFGALANNPGQVTASSISLGKSISGVPEHASYSDALNGWLLEPNPALERSGLHCNLATDSVAFALAPNLGLFCCAERSSSDWFQHFEILETMPLRIDKVKKALRNRDCTQVEVKTRGKTIDPNQWQLALSSKSSGELLTIFALRLGKKRVALVTRRHARQ